VEAPEEPVLINCDSQQVARVFTNLLQNAVDAIHGRHEREQPAAGDNESASGHVWVSVRAESGELRVDIADDGCGLPKGYRNSLTEPYVTTREKGTGLGLAIVMKIMEDHGGSLRLKDRKGGGTVASVSFPLSEERGQENRESGGRSKIASATPKRASGA